MRLLQTANCRTSNRRVANLELRKKEDPIGKANYAARSGFPEFKIRRAEPQRKKKGAASSPQPQLPPLVSSFSWARREDAPAYLSGGGVHKPFFFGANKHHDASNARARRGELGRGPAPSPHGNAADYHGCKACAAGAGLVSAPR